MEIRLIILMLVTLPHLNVSGQSIDDFALVNVIDNNQVSLSDYRSSTGVVLVFASNSCPYSKRYESRIRDLYDRFSGSGINFLLVNSNDASLSPADGEENIKSYIQEEEWPFPYLVDRDQAVFKQFEATKNPEAFLLKPGDNGFSIIYRGAIDDNPQNIDDVHEPYLENSIQRLINNMPITSMSTRPVGCMIRYN